MKTNKLCLNTLIPTFSRRKKGLNGVYDNLLGEKQIFILLVL